MSVVWTALILSPMLNILAFLYAVLFHNFGLAIILFTVIVRLATLPLTRRQIRSTKKMQEIQPKIQEIRRKYAGDKQKASQAQMRLMKEAGVNPIGCLGPMVIQFPIWIGLYQAIIALLPTSPEALARLSIYLYPWLPFMDTLIPLNRSFIGLDLGLEVSQQGFMASVLLPILVGASMWAQQKMTAMPSMDARSESTNRMMLWMMPFMFGFFTLQFPAGLALYWVVSAAIGIAIQYRITGGWGNLLSFNTGKSRETTTQGASSSDPINEDPKEESHNGQVGNDRKNRGGSDRNRPHGARRRPRGGRGRGR